MKPIFSKEYYEANWERFLEPENGEDYINLEAELEKEMRTYEGLGIGENELAIIRKIEAQKIADRCTKLVYKERDIVKSIENGESSFGYTTERQEIEARARFRKRFEFNCLQRRKFIEKYKLQ